VTTSVQHSEARGDSMPTTVLPNLQRAVIVQTPAPRQCVASSDVGIHSRDLRRRRAQTECPPPGLASARVGGPKRRTKTHKDTDNFLSRI
jgi:hypothetical protein